MRNAPVSVCQNKMAQNMPQIRNLAGRCTYVALDNSFKGSRVGTLPLLSMAAGTDIM